MKRIQSIGIIYNTLVPAACEMTSTLAEHLGLKDKGWVCPAESMDSMASAAPNTDLIITVGGDGTILRAVKLTVFHTIPILGINMGRLGFMTELEGYEALEKLPQYLDGSPWVEERAMLQVQLLEEGGGPKPGVEAHHALNDAVIGRRAISRLITVGATIDGAHLTTYRADAVIVATATGSTGYNLSVGGPILYPEARAMIIKPVAPHLGLATGLVVPSTSLVEFTIESEQQAMLIVDGYLNLPLDRNDRIQVQTSPYKARFLRINPPTHYFHTLTRRLDFGGALPRATPLGP